MAGSSPPVEAGKAPPAVVLLRGVTVWPAAGALLEGRDVLLRAGRIAGIGQGLPVPEGALVIEARGLHLTPGLIDPHSHLGVYPAPALKGNGDGNEVGKPLSPQMRAADALWPQDPGIPRALAAGVTAVHVVPGSANLVGGEGVVIRPLPGRSARDLLLVQAPRTLKMACGENPKRVYEEKGGPFSRMGNVARVREVFQSALEYRRAWQRHAEALARWQEQRARRCKEGGEAGSPAGQKELDLPPAPPARDLGLESLVEVLEGKVQAHMHCYRADEMSLMLEVARELGFQVKAFHHATEAYKVRDRLQAAGTGAVVWVNWWGFKVEALDAIPENAALLAEAGVVTAMHSDSALVIQRLNQEAALVYHRGRTAGIALEQTGALGLVTLQPARLLGIDAVTGSIEEGKLADLVLWDRHPFSVYARVEKVFVEGALAFDRRATDFELDLVPDPAPLDAPADVHALASVPAGWAVPPGPVRESPPASAPASTEVTAIMGATVHTMLGPPLAPATVLLRGDRVVAVGHFVKIPPEARRIDGEGLEVTPGLIAAESALGLVEISLESSARDHQPRSKEAGAVRADLRAWEALNPASAAIPVSRLEGFTTALVRPFGGVVSGQSAAFDLRGLHPWENGLAGPLAVHVNLGIQGSAAAGGSRALALMRLRRLLEDASILRSSRAEVEGRRYRALAASHAQLTALLPVVERQIPLVVKVDRAADILAALGLAAKQKVRVVLSGAAEGWLVADDIARAGVPVLVEVDANLPSDFDSLAARYDNAARLHRAGVVVALSAAGEAHHVRFLRQQAGLAVAWGLPHLAALAALTRQPAAIFGLRDRGTLAPGTLANVAVWDGDPLELSTRLVNLFIHGQELPLTSRQVLLRDRYRQIPSK